MVFTKHSFSSLVLASTLACGALAAPKWGGWGGHQECPAKTLYIATNGASNAVVAISVGSGGLLDAVTSVTPTGGVGGAAINNVTTGSLAGPDSFGSQGSLQVAGDLLFVVNAGSNTLSTFKINPYNPSSLTPLSTVSTNGDFPISVAVSPEGIVCVANTGAATGVSCASYSSSGTSSFDALRPITLGQTNPPTGPLNGLAQVLFSDDQSQLLTIVKGDTMTKPSLVTSYAVSAKSVSYTPVSISPTGSKVLFGTTTIPGTSKLLASDAGFGALLLDLDNLATPLGLANVTNQKAICWATYSALTGTGFVDDVLVSQITEIDVDTGAIVAVHPSGNGGVGSIDLKAVGDKIYALSPGNGTQEAAVTVFELGGGRGAAVSVQNFGVGSSGAGRMAEGLAVWTGCEGHWSGGWGTW